MSDANVFNSCRSCLLLSNEMYPIFQTVVEDEIQLTQILNYFSIEIEENDDLPKSMCHSCIIKFHDAYTVIETFKKSQETLQHSKEDIEDQKDMMTNDNGAADETNFEESNQLMADFFNREEIEDTVHMSKDSDNESHDSDDVNYLIERSVKLTQKYRDDFGTNSLADEEFEDNQNETRIKRNHSQEKKKVKVKQFLPANLESLFCSVCDKTFNLFEAFSAHIKKHTENIFCVMCYKDFANSDLYLRHYRSIHRRRCKICNIVFPKQELWTKHMHGHGNVLQKYPCEAKNCTKMFFSKQSLDSHYTTVHTERRNFLCPLCGESFKNNDNLKYHIRKHNGPSHVCFICKQAFMQDADLKDHMWRHTGVKPYKCVKCGKGFTKKRTLSVHERKICGLVKSGRFLCSKLNST